MDKVKVCPFFQNGHGSFPNRFYYFIIFVFFHKKAGIIDSGCFYILYSTDGKADQK